MRKLLNEYNEKETYTELNIAGRNIVLIDKCSLPLIVGYHWRVESKGYAITTINGKIVKMHRLLTGFSTLFTDHINGNRLDNRMSNLRLVDAGANACNVGINRRNTSGTVGVSYDKNACKWHSRIALDRKEKH